MARVTIVDDAGELAATGALRITTAIEKAIAARDAAIVCLTGGSTPARLYEALADPDQPWRARIDWGRVHLFWGDERHVPPDHPDSNFGMANRTLLSRVPVPAAHVHRMEGERADARDAAHAYEAVLRDRRFDVMLLGLGEDAHIASIFPGSSLIEKQDALVGAAWVPHLNAWRITLTPPALLDAREIFMIVSGASKADAVRAALNLPEDVTRYPAQILRRAGDRVEWIIDRAAARSLDAPPAR